MIKTKWMVRVLAIAMMVITFGLVAGCGGSGGGDAADDVGGTIDIDNSVDSDVATAKDFAGVWLIRKENTTSYWIFNENGTFQKKRAGQPINSGNHFSGTFSVNEGLLSGSFTNPGVGRGDIKGLLDEDDTFLMDFIEYWHTPPKVVPCIGVRP